MASDPALSSRYELDLLLVRGGTKVGFEIKRTVAPQVTRSIRSAQQTLGNDRLYLVHAGSDSFPLGNDIEAMAARDLATRTDLWRNGLGIPTEARMPTGGAASRTGLADARFVLILRRKGDDVASHGDHPSMGQPGPAGSV
jgi:hypothetical protein